MQKLILTYVGCLEDLPPLQNHFKFYFFYKYMLKSLLKLGVQSLAIFFVHFIVESYISIVAEGLQ